MTEYWIGQLMYEQQCKSSFPRVKMVIAFYCKQLNNVFSVDPLELSCCHDIKAAVDM